MLTSERTLQYFKKQGLKADKVEMPYNMYSKTRKDLFNIIDIIVLTDRVLGVQACGLDVQGHVKKISENPNTIDWLKTGAGLELYAWRKVKLKRGGKAIRWKPRVIIFSIKNNKVLNYEKTMEILNNE